MKKLVNNRTLMTIATVLSMAVIGEAQTPEMPKPGKEHELLSQIAGQWEVTAEATLAPGQEPMKCEGSESAKMVGGFWLISQGEANMQGVPMHSLMTLGYDSGKKKYVGTFVCSMDSTLWKYEGSMDESGKKLTLETEGPSMVDRSKTAKYREILELKDKNHKTFTSSVLDDGGKWVKMVSMDNRRKK